MLLKARVKMELLHDLDMRNMTEKMKRGGLCVVGSKRYVKANSQHMPDYAETESQSTSYTRTPIISMVVACLNIYLTNTASGINL